MLLIYVQSTSCNSLRTIHMNIGTSVLIISPYISNWSKHEVTLPEFHSMFSTYNVLPGQRICMKCFKRAKDNVAASTITIEMKLRWMRMRRKTKSQLTLYTILSINLWSCLIVLLKRVSNQRGPFKQAKGR